MLCFFLPCRLNQTNHQTVCFTADWMTVKFFDYKDRWSDKYYNRPDRMTSPLTSFMTNEDHSVSCVSTESRRQHGESDISGEQYRGKWSLILYFSFTYFSAFKCIHASMVFFMRDYERSTLKNCRQSVFLVIPCWGPHHHHQQQQQQQSALLGEINSKIESSVVPADDVEIPSLQVTLRYVTIYSLCMYCVWPLTRGRSLDADRWIGIEWKYDRYPLSRDTRIHKHRPIYHWIELNMAAAQCLFDPHKTDHDWRFFCTQLLKQCFDGYRNYWCSAQNIYSSVVWTPLNSPVLSLLFGCHFPSRNIQF